MGWGCVGWGRGRKLPGGWVEMGWGWKVKAGWGSVGGWVGLRVRGSWFGDRGMEGLPAPNPTSMSNLARSGLNVMAVQLSLGLQALISGDDFLRGLTGGVDRGV